ncbi:cytoplasmic protein [Cohnella kolymensis]|uniref:Cytoplasmic protein n=1 Tax=Cohnella kolymensis TaxID=1590652 RepID=A0ABR5A603_9BACL|nr:DUF1697 domain-containing protein [Cohnella kolymensis]KIL35101.1 cytoplasmic protein [Cohnella kolymensis]KIL36510.1 cytoplasmic protein [Cohnella kolymensis]
MAIYFALLRGINVGGKNIIKMAELKRMFEAMGLSRVQTYIQSGNVLFESNDEEERLRERIEHEIQAVFGFPVKVILRTAEELKRIAASCPFSEQEVAEAEAFSEGEKLYVGLLLEKPSSEGIERLKPYQSVNDQYRVVGKEVFLLFRDSVRNSKLAANLEKLGVPVTVRNWKTMNKLVALAHTIEVK